jgi:hypothetical protein
MIGGVVKRDRREFGDVMKNRIYALGVLALTACATPAIAQTVAPAVPYGQTAALPPGGVLPQPVDPNAPYWVQLEGYNGNGSVSKHWELVRPQDFDVTNYRGFHTGTN